ncbi:MAG: BREX-1 system adenine-specific DNA-methyltransferase PglX [Devosia sp.]|uniref:BREX-1 system adenine-specific DNA-methyltransferase PglX n=1 Tax=Devosia sp. TaxID=1871048 RepID=UPI001A5CD9EC|nr:BREX-1 system adenine-specific DNA-methyltransferase PglX [Devosia sp.]MBL8596416.1 BREX-1 system adenine-specific DNA-methyltransferase PglX [Devosia sp.]
MDTGALKKFAQAARNHLMEQVRGKLGLVLAEGSAARRETPQAVKDLESTIAANGREQVVEQVAYTWFNRFTALRFMDVNGYNSIRVVSPAEGQTRPELIAEALAGNVDEAVPAAIKAKVLALLDGRSPSNDPQGEAYRLLLVTTCNQWHEHMPFMFEKISDFTELLMPDDLLSQNSILAHTRNAMTEEACQDVEVIGWLYQFYISEKKDQVFAGLKKNQKITAENIPAATQLFTPHWIVRYLVENSLGRLWLLNRPGSKLAERMDYYIAPEEPEADFPRVKSPKEIKVCDPACGSAHMLTYAFDLLYAIYEEEGFDPTEIPSLILEHNLTGIEIDDRAGALAAFALAMKAAARLGRRRFLRLEARPNVVVLQNVTFTSAEMQDVIAVVGRDLFSSEFSETLAQFEQAKNFGSLIVPRLRDPTETLRVVVARDFGGDLLLKELQGRVHAVLRMVEALSTAYHVVVANPPYKGSSDLNKDLSGWLDTRYPDSKTDLFSAFIERGLRMTGDLAYCSMVTMESWMFLDSFRKLRKHLLHQNTILGLVHMPYLGKGGTPMGISFGTSAFTIRRALQRAYKADYVYIRYFETDNNFVPLQFPTENERRVRVSADQLDAIPDSPIAYWASDELRKIFNSHSLLKDEAPVRKGIDTGKNDRFLRYWYEVADENRSKRSKSEKWFDYVKGGELRKWYGNIDLTLNWENDGADVRAHPSSTIRNQAFFFKPAVTWSLTGSKGFGARIVPVNCMFDNNGSSIFPRQDQVQNLACFLNSKVAELCLGVLNPTVAYQVGDIARLPYAVDVEVGNRGSRLHDIAKNDWDFQETSWDFLTLPLLSFRDGRETMEDSCEALRAHFQSMTDEMRVLEEENNRILIDAYGLQNELTPEVPNEKITLTCNPAYRYGVKGSEAEREARLLEDTVAEFIHYAVGCMFGRYSLDMPSLVLANQGERLEDYLAKVPSPTFVPDKDNVIPVLDGEWFADDVTERFRKFLRVTFGEENYRENLAFVEKALGKDIRKWFTRDFFDYHVRRFKKRPIYWLFSSPKGTFQALMYMHRYRPETVSVLLNDYLREHIRKLEGHRAALDRQADDPATPPAKATRARKDIITVSQQIDELKDWERDVIFPLAQQRIEIDLDDGVKTNYPKFGAALRAIKGLEATDE